MGRPAGTAVPGRLGAVSPRLAFVFFALGIVTRLPFQTDNLWAHDSVLYERAIERFDPLDQRPQPPGYLYYVLLIRALSLVTADANRAMTVVSLVAGAAAVALLYVLAARLYDERTARVSGLFLLTAVTFWAYGGIAYPYTLLGALTIACALLLWRAATARPERRLGSLVAASALWGVAIGFRSDLAIFLAPAWLVAAWGKRLAVAAAGAIVIGSLTVAWYLASAAAGGGLARFAEALRIQAQFVDDRYSVFGPNGVGMALHNNLYELGRFLGRGLYFLAPLVAAVPLSGPARHIELTDRRRALFVAAWTLTPLLVYIPIHSGEYGYVFSMLPGLALIAARGAIALARGARMPRTLPWVVGAVVLANASIFLLSDTPLSAADLARKDKGTVEKYAYLHEQRLDRATVIAAYDYEVAARYAPADSRDLIGYDPAGPSLVVVVGTGPCAAVTSATLRCSTSPAIAIWDDLIRVRGPGWEEVRMPHGALLRIARDASGARLRIAGLEVTLDR
jgi:4-amino-4-deoxy-L-arabinose transferase-like glycosyltransferase